MMNYLEGVRSLHIQLSLRLKKLKLMFMPLFQLSAENAAENVTERIKTYRDHLLDAAKAENKSQEQ